MGRTRRMGPRPQLSRTEIQYLTLERFKKLKKHKDEPLYDIYDRACTALEAQTDMEENLNTMRTNMPKIQKRLTEKSTDVFGFIESLSKEDLMKMLSEENRGRFSEDTILEIRKVLSTKDLFSI